MNLYINQITFNNKIYKLGMIFILNQCILLLIWLSVNIKIHVIYNIYNNHYYFTLKISYDSIYIFPMKLIQHL